MLEIGEKIKRRRVSLGLTQEELAARVELSKGFISQVERDLTSPSIATLTMCSSRKMRTRAIQYIGLYQTPRRTPWSPYL